MAEPPEEATQPPQRDPSLQRSLPPRPSSLTRYWDHDYARDPSWHAMPPLSAGGTTRRRPPRGLQMATPGAGRPEEQGPAGSGGGGLCLEPREHAWMLAAAEGRWEALQELLVADPGLALRADPISGYTLLHWLAKHGRHEELILLHTFAQQQGLPLDVSAAGSGGLTALHLAAMQGHQLAVKVLVGALGADPTRRDYSGRRACSYLPSGAPSSLRELSGAEDWEVEAAGPQHNANNNSNSGMGRRPTSKASRMHRLSAGDKDKDKDAAGGKVSRFLRQFLPFLHNR